MDNPTLISVQAASGLALVLFFVAFVEKSRRAVTLPPRLPLGKVAVWPYVTGDLLGIGAVAGVFYLLAVGNAVVAGGTKEVSISYDAVLFSIGFLFVMALVCFFITARRIRPVSWLGLRWKESPWIVLIAPGTVMAMWAFFAGLQGLGYMDLMDRLGVDKVQDTVAVFQEEQDVVLLSLMAFAAVVVAPVCEEIIFRGYLYPVAKRFAGPWVAALCNALLFSAAHGSLSALLPLFAFGLVLVLIYEMTGSIWAPMAVHFVFNAATVSIQILIRVLDIPVPAAT